MSNSEDTGKLCTIVVADLFAKINAQRKLIKKTPIEDRALVSRCTLRFNINRSRWVDFAAEKITLTQEDISALEKMVNEQFGLFFAGELNSLCIKQSKRPAVQAAVELDTSEMEAAFAAASTARQSTGIIGWIMRLFGGR